MRRLRRQIHDQRDVRQFGPHRLSARPCECDRVSGRAIRPRAHLFVAAELLTGARDKSEQTPIDSFLQTFDLALPNEADGLTALDLYRQFHLSHGVDWPDCQIAATALRLRVEVFTQNVKHFTAFPGVGVVRAY